MPIERLQAFYRRYYQPDNAVLVVAGQVRSGEDAAADRGEVRPDPAARPRTGAEGLWPTYTADPTQDGEREVTLRRVGDVQVAMAVYHVPAGAHPDYAAVDVLAPGAGQTALGPAVQGAGRHQAGRRRVGAFNFQLQEPGALIAYAQVRKEDPI